MIEIRPAKSQDHQPMWEIFHRVIQTGDTYVYPPTMTQAEFNASWLSAPEIQPYVAVLDDPDNPHNLQTPAPIGGMYILKPNFPGLGSHVANASFMVNPDCQGKGIGRALGHHALEEARSLGYQAMQFNIVISTNTVAVNLWKSLGFNIIATSPKSFQHQTLGLVDAYIMHRFL